MRTLTFGAGNQQKGRIDPDTTEGCKQAHSSAEVWAHHGTPSALNPHVETLITEPVPRFSRKAAPNQLQGLSQSAKRCIM